MTTTPGFRSRFDALDTLRCLAVLFMVQGHTFTLVVEDATRALPWYRWHNYLHGFTGPAFLFGAGLAFGVTTLHALDPHLAWTASLRRRLYRYFSLLAIGYAIQLPPLHSPAISARHIELFARVEALQHIGIAMLVCQGLVFALRTRGRVVGATAALAAGFVLIGPWMSRQPLEQHLPLGLAAYLTSKAGSTYPLVPWAGFVFAGVAAGGLLRRRAMFAPSWWLAGGLPLVGGGLVALSLGFDAIAPGAFGEHPYWKVSPYFFLRRLGWLLVLLGGFALADAVGRRGASALSTARPGVIRRYIRLISQSSLVIYVAHLFVLFGTPLYPGLRPYSHALGAPVASLLVLLLLCGLVVFAQLWDRLDRSWARPFQRVRKGAVVALGGLVLFACGASARPLPRPEEGRPLQLQGVEPEGEAHGVAETGDRAIGFA